MDDGVLDGQGSTSTIFREDGSPEGRRKMGEVGAKEEGWEWKLLGRGLNSVDSSRISFTSSASFRPRPREDTTPGDNSDLRGHRARGARVWGRGAWRP